MKKDNKKCRSCGSFRAYYSRAYCCLLRENNGYCQRHCAVMSKDNSCDQWHSRRTSKEKRKTIAMACIPEIFHKMAVLEVLLKEEFEIEQLEKKINSDK